MNIEVIIWYLILVDSIMANVMVWFSPKFMKWYKKMWFSKLFPVTKGWCVYYLILVIWIGYLLYRMGSLN
jgi:hypothetical protein